MTMNKLILIMIAIFTLWGCDHKQKITMPGYIEGKYTYISPNFGGVLKSVSAHRGDMVEQGQPLFTLEAIPEREDLQAATARVKEASNQKSKFEANYNLQKADMDRQLYLYKNDIISKEEFQTSMSAYRQAFADLQAAEGKLKRVTGNSEKSKLDCTANDD